MNPIIAYTEYIKTTIIPASKTSFAPKHELPQINQNTYIQDNVVVHGLRDEKYEKDGEKYSVYIGKNTSLAHQSQVHGPAIIGDNVFDRNASFCI